jgi:hypothetical protein
MTDAAEAEKRAAVKAAYEKCAEIALAQIAELGLSDNPACVRFEPSHAMAKKIAAVIREEAAE